MSLKNVSSKSVRKGGGSSISHLMKKSLKKKSLKKKSMSISKSGIVRNSPIKEFNNLKLKDKLLEKKSLMKVFDGMKELKQKGYSNRIMETQEYCRYLRTHIDNEKMDKIMDILGIKDSSLMTMEEKCQAIKEKAPYIMSPRSTNLLMYFFVDYNIRVFLATIFWLASFSGGLFSIVAKAGLYGLGILQVTDIINYYGGTTFFLRLSRSAQSTMRHKIFHVIGDDTRDY